MNEPQNAAPQNAQIHAQLGRKYDAGFITDIETDSLPPGLSEDIIRALSAKKHEPEWMTQWRLEAYRHFLTMKQPDWAKLSIGPIDLQALSYYSAPKGPKYKSLDEVPQELLDTYDKLGVDFGVLRFGVLWVVHGVFLRPAPGGRGCARARDVAVVPASAPARRCPALRPPRR